MSDPNRLSTKQSDFEFNRILTGDCLEILSQVPDDSIHFVVTSPPYNVGIQYDKHHDQLEYSVYRDWLRDVWTELKRVLVSGGRFALNVAPNYFAAWCIGDL